MSQPLMLDTNAVSALVKGRAPALTGLLGSRPCCISVITEAEMRYGLARRPLHRDLRTLVEALLDSIDIRPWTSRTASRYGTLRAELDALGKPLAPLDLLIAAHALTEGCVLVSADRAFTRVPGLVVEEYLQH
ncbi:type II toxin-antitoxin system VapC family toxin [Methylotetracoccus oryzae]|uniref:type II toxin-antitoxin system VapC family toxin n=1 Tax=Methylotetracoccus oryzae TaxID=1919059 RepID=UPI0019125F0C|nr:type II toxin-antitoxin system VapC family toxin [Methylotetracoccus oryzae]